MKILYAAANNENSKFQLERFLKAINKKHIIKIAAYKISTPDNTIIDWTLDSLLNPFDSNLNILTKFNSNFNIYYNQIKYFSPDLIISDLDHFTSQIATYLNITLWQCSSSLVYYGLKVKPKIRKNFEILFKKQILSERKINLSMIDNSDFNFVYSHFGDLLDQPKLKNNFEWIRPYHTIGITNNLCKHNIVFASTDNNKKILNCLQKEKDIVIFSYNQENYKNIISKNLNDEKEYFCNLKNSNIFVCEGQQTFLSDAYYNNKFTITYMTFKNIDLIINNMFSETYAISSSIYDFNKDINEYIDLSITSFYNKNIKYLHEKIEEI